MKLKSRKFLNIGGNSKEIPVPACYAGWVHLLLDIDPSGNPDIICDARNLETLDAGQFDAVYCSHNLEHYYHHEVPLVLKGIRHVLKPSGFAMIVVPDLEALMRTIVEQGLDLDDVLGETEFGIPVLVRDLIYGWSLKLELSGQDYYAHKTGFTYKSLDSTLRQNGFKYVFVQRSHLSLSMVAFMRKPSAWCRNILGLA